MPAKATAPAAEKRPRGRPKSSNRRARNVQMADETYATFQRAGNGLAADGAEIVAKAYRSTAWPYSPAGKRR